jgi:Ca2+-binding EF-hand superfamily protein
MKKGGKQAPTPASRGFNAASFVKPGLSEDEVNEIKKAFDLFDTDQGGSVDLKGIMMIEF